MSFKPANLVQWSAPAKTRNLPQWWGYFTADDSIATVEAADYFNLNYGLVIGNNTTFYIGDLLYCVCTDGVAELQITAVSPNVLTTASNAQIPAGSITHAMLGANIVQANNIADNSILTQQLDPTTIQYAKVPMTAAQWNGMYGAPFELLAAPGANKAIIVRGVVAAMTFVAAQYAAGGAVIVQYDTTVHGAGSNACGTGTIAAAAVNGFAASSSAGLVGQVPVAGIANSTFVNKDVSISNQTAAFTTGDGTWNIHVWYEVVTL